MPGIYKLQCLILPEQMARAEGQWGRGHACPEFVYMVGVERKIYLLNKLEVKQMKKWWWVVALGTLALGFMIASFTGSRYILGGGYAKPTPGPGLGSRQGGYMMDYMHDSTNWNDMARIMGDPENRQAMVNIMNSPEMRQAMADAMLQPEMRQSMAEVMSDPKARRAFVDMMALPQMQPLIGDMAADQRVRPYMEKAVNAQR